MPRSALVVLVPAAVASLVAFGCSDGSNLDDVVAELESRAGTDSEPAGDTGDQTSTTTSSVPPSTLPPEDPTPELGVDEQAVIDSLSGGALVDGIEARCLIDGINDASISPVDVLTNSVTLEDELIVSDLVLTCFEHPENMAGFVRNFAQGFAATADRSLSPDQAVCMVAALGAHDATMSTLESEEGLSQELTADLQDCLFGTSAGQFEPGQQYGDNPTLDRLWDECEDGVMVSCDELFGVSEIDSEYEAFGATCGNREPEAPGGSCDAPDSYGDSGVLDGYWDACEAGDGVACDQLYFESPFGSVYEAFGNTCGYRFEESPGFCEDVLP